MHTVLTKARKGVPPCHLYIVLFEIWGNLFAKAINTGTTGQQIKWTPLKVLTEE
jgi:hypothetical protein